MVLINELYLKKKKSNRIPASCLFLPFVVFKSALAEENLTEYLVDSHLNITYFPYL